MYSEDELFAQLSRLTDVDSPGFAAVDGVDRLTLCFAKDVLELAHDGEVAVIDDAYGALTLGVAHRYHLRAIRVHQDLLTGERALRANAATVGLTDCFRQCRLDAELLDGASVVLMRMPRALSALAQIADAVARYADPKVVLFAGGRDKYLSHTMNDVLGEAFTQVRASLGRQKSRVLRAERPRLLGRPPFPVHTYVSDIGIAVVAHGTVFAGANSDVGTLLLHERMPHMAPRARTAIDLGCGSGVLAVTMAGLRPELQVTATDLSASAVASARATASVNGVADRVSVIRDDALSSFADGSVELIVCNLVSMYRGTSAHTEATIRMFRAAARVMAPGAELWTVYDDRHNYRGVLERLVGPTDVVARNHTTRLTRSVKKSALP